MPISMQVRRVTPVTVRAKRELSNFHFFIDYPGTWGPPHHLFILLTCCSRAIFISCSWRKLFVIPTNVEESLITSNAWIFVTTKIKGSLDKLEMTRIYRQFNWWHWERGWTSVHPHTTDWSSSRWSLFPSFPLLNVTSFFSYVLKFKPPPWVCYNVTQLE